LDRQAKAWLRQNDAERRREMREHERQERRDQQARIRTMRHEATMARRADAAYRRQKAALERDGWSAAEAEEMLSHYDVNPSSRLAIALGQLGIAVAAALGGRRNPQLGGATDPSARSESETFHGTTRGAARLSPAELRQADSLPRDVVVLGTLESLAYKPPRGSSRGGAIWEHEAGDRGIFRSKGKGRSMLVADPRTGKVDIVGGPMRFKPSVGLWD
jgi:hypothetical protein